MNLPYEVSRKKLIYVFGIPDRAHRGLLKIGETTFTGDLDADARRRIDEYTRTAGTHYELLHTELAVTNDGDTFRDYDVHRVLKNFKQPPKGTKAREWFKVNLETVKAAISAVKQGKSHIDGATNDLPEIIFRAEQEDAISRTVKHFKKHNIFLWNAKMRFGKTICALEVVKRMNFGKTIIITHRPVVNAGWYDDFRKIFRDGKFSYVTAENFCAAGDKNFVCFASMQDLRGSEVVGGGFNKREEIFATDWDCVIVDEAHEGTKTPLGDSVIKNLIKSKTKLLALSGTPFNIIDDFDEEATFTWDYVDEQHAKAAWDAEHPKEILSNPYAELPRMNILAYDLGELFGYVEDKTFNFGEFFHTDGNDFVHAADVKKFLDLLVKRDDNNYPFARADWRDMFRHTLWIVPGVKEGRALSKLLQNHRIFGAFEIVNVAGSGDCDDEPADALTKVRNAIDAHNYTITLSCGKLTAGVTVPEWSAVFMLKGGSSAMSYLQTIFRVQSPCRKRGGKDNCYVFDFAPDRTLKVVAEAVAVSTRAGKTTEAQRKALKEFLNFCPVIAMQGSRMEQLNEKKILTQLKRVYIDRVVRRGFDDTYLYNDELLNLNEAEMENFATLGKFVGTSGKQGDIVINDRGLTDKIKKTRTPRDRSPEEIENDRRKRQRLNAIKILRGISIRMPLLIYGADVPINADITIDDFAGLIDDDSWAEFMPKGVTKDFFANFIKFYDRDVFIAAGHRVRQRALRADKLSPAERVEKIAELFDTFKNPDKETVLTPWRVVDLHLSSLPADIFTHGKKILDINSKTGLYGLWTALKIYRTTLGNFSENDFKIDAQRRIWDKIVAENVFVICKTPMAVKITRRTLIGYRGGTVNAEFFADLITTLKATPSTFTDRITQKDFWHKGVGKMFFDAVVGNPPYQIITDSDSTRMLPVYNHFIDASFKLADKVSLIHPARCLFNAGYTPKEFNQRLLNNKHVKVIRYEADSTKFFPSSDIKGGVVITYYDANKNFGAIDTFTQFEELNLIYRKVVAENKNFQPLSKIIRGQMTYRLTQKAYEDIPDLASRVSERSDTALRTNAFEVMPDVFLTEKPNDGHEYIQVLGRVESQRVYRYVRREYMEDIPVLNAYKVFVPASNGSGALGEVVGTPLVGSPLVGSPLVGSTQTFISVGAFDTLAEAQACIAYIKSKFCRAMLGILKVTQHNPPATWSKVPLQDFTSASDIDWHGDIEAQLYRKYDLTAAEIEFIESHVKAMD